MKQGWEVKKLGDLCRIELGKTPYRADKSFWDNEKQTENVWLSIADLLNTDADVVSDSKEYISDKAAKISKVVRKGTLLLSFKLTLGRLAFAGRDLFTNEAIAALTIENEKEINKYFLYQFLSLFDWNAATKGDVKVKGKTLNKAKLKEIEVYYPRSLSEQQRIVAILNEAFAAIAKAKANAEQNLKNAKELFESYLQSVFENRGEGWEEKSFSELCSIKHGFAFPGENFSNKGEYILLTPGNFFESGGYRDRGDKQKYYVGEIPLDYVLKKGDLLVAMTEQAAGLLGSPILIPDSNRFLHNQRLGLVVSKPGIPWTNEFFFHVFNTPTVRENLHNSGTGVKVRHTSPTRIGNVKVCFPPSITEQNEIVATLKNLSAETKKLEDHLPKKNK
jgi:type I restriction enzyme S subunit